MNKANFDPPDLEHLRRLARLPPGQRIHAMLDARELAVGLIRGRLRRSIYVILAGYCLRHKVMVFLSQIQQSTPFL